MKTISESDIEYKWFAINTGFRREKYVHKLLNRKKIVAYLPLIRRTRKYRSRIKTYSVPLLSCYVFVYIRNEERVRVLETEYVKGFVKFEGRAIPIPPHEIAILKKIVGQYDVSVVEYADFRNGDRVELLAGELTGLKGRIIEGKGKKRYLVKFEGLGINLTWTVASSKLRKVV